MKSYAVLAGACVLALTGAGTAGAQSFSGTPNSPYPLAAPHEVRDGCRTVLDPNTRTTRIPVDCGQPETTGGIIVGPGQVYAPGVPLGVPAAGAPGGVYPYAAPQEVRDGCRTVLDPNTRTTRIPVDC